MRHPDFSGEIDRDALSIVLRFNYVPAPQSIYRDIHKLRPGHLLAVRQGGEPQIEAWWSLAAARAKGTSVPFAGSEDEAVSALEALLGDAVQKRMIADVPLGAFLSGGVDRSEEHTSLTPVTNAHLVCRLLLEKKNNTQKYKQHQYK